jgi:hypothetical protein
MLEEFHQEDAKQCRREMDARGERDVKRYAKFLQANAAQVRLLEAEHFKQPCSRNMVASLDEYAGKLRALFDEFEEQERRADALDDNNGKSNGNDKQGETDDKKDKTPARTRTRSRSRSPRPSIASQPEEEKTSTETPGSRNRSPSPSTAWIEPIA